MNLLLHLESILSDFRFMFNSQNFALFQAFIYGFITHTREGTLTQLYQSSASQTRYWSLPKVPFPREMGPRCGGCTSHEISSSDISTVGLCL